MLLFQVITIKLVDSCLNSKENCFNISNISLDVTHLVRRYPIFRMNSQKPSITAITAENNIVRQFFRRKSSPKCYPLEIWRSVENISGLKIFVSIISCTTIYWGKNTRYRSLKNKFLFEVVTIRLVDSCLNSKENCFIFHIYP